MPLRLAGLPAQSSELRLQSALGVLCPREVGLSRAQLGVRLCLAHVQAADAGRLLQHQASLVRTGTDEGADPALADQRRRPRAAGEVSEQCLHVARPHLPPVDAVGAARPAPELADHLHFEKPGEGRGKAAARERQRHRGVAMAEAGGGAGEDEVVHLRAAQRPSVPLAHRPAQRVGHVALAAAIGSDDAGKAGQDGELYRIGEAFEPGDAQLGEVHGHAQPHHASVVGVGVAGAPRPALLKGGTRGSLDQPCRGRARRQAH